jgi:hypothetical protein
MINPPYMPKFVSHRYCCVYNMLKLLILSLMTTYSSEMLGSVLKILVVSHWSEDDLGIWKSLIPPHIHKL